MSANELAFLTLGLVLGIAVGAALVEVLRTRPRKAGGVRITMTRDAVPPRATTLAGAAAPASFGPAAMGPGDHAAGPSRRVDEDEAGVPAAPRRELREGIDVVAVPVASATASTGWVDAAGGSPVEPFPDRTAAPYRRRYGPETTVGIPIRPSPDPAIAAINVLVASGSPSARRTSVATSGEYRLVDTDARASAAPVPAAAPWAGAVPLSDDAASSAPARSRPLSAVLGRDPAAIARVAAAVARGPEEAARLEELLGDLADAIATRAADAGSVDPVGYGFWHEFDIAETRGIVEALAALGFRFDLRDGFLDGLVPGQRDLSLAVAYAGLDPRRLRRWPPERELAELFRGASVASERFVLASAPRLERHQVQSLLGPLAEGLAPLFAAWDRVAPVLLGEA